ncbi:hypothetical protein [Phenylobacterium sp. J367]|uniref:hypothetical protein n=1 Tax=Phenylobacterium sp. J367 TaxID=2898435 RepID=UPI0021517937|nr:hypothetical protein [Phenylobacterium sp. J367]MCR5879284.1 hypothetical protein [Phenylobacterium sp. J367]
MNRPLSPADTSADATQLLPAAYRLAALGAWRRIVNFDALVDECVADRHELDLFEFAQTPESARRTLLNHGRCSQAEPGWDAARDIHA